MVAATEQGVSLAKLAAEAMAECNNNRRQASALMQRWLQDDPDLFARLLPQFVRDGCDAAVAGVDTDTRRRLRALAIRSAPDHPSQRRHPVNIVRPPNPDRALPHLMALLERQETDPEFYAWPLPAGKPLGDATPADVLLAARFYADGEATSRINRRFLELVHERMQGGSCVRKVLSHAALLRLRRQAEEDKRHG